MEFIKLSNYDRQNRTIGIDGTKKLVSSKVIIIGLKEGLATESSSKLILSGVSNLVLINDGPIELSDLSTGFYYKESDIGIDRSEILMKKLLELNPYANINCQNFESVDLSDENSIIILHGGNKEEAIMVNNLCRKNNIKFVWVTCRGISGFVFVDALNNHVVIDSTGEIIDPVQLASLSNDGKITCAQNNSHDFQTDDVIKLSNLEGDNLEFLEEKSWQIRVINKTSFEIVDFPNLDFNFINGTATIIKQVIDVNHNLLEEEIKNPTIVGFNNEFDNDVLNINLSENEIPNNSWGEEMENYLSEYNNNDLKKIVRSSHVKLMPVVSILGSIAAKESIKLITNKFTPINQWIVYSDPTIVPDDKPIMIDSSGIGNIFGTETRSIIENKSWLMVGCGAIGCEMLKNLAKMNFACEGGSLFVTDPDHIEHSNLCRQFLFRNRHVNNPKSIVAAEMIKEINPKININAMTEKMCPENQDLLNKLSSNIYGVINALDNITARRYMDEQCFRFGKPLFESGTQGMKGNTQPIIPFVTETYSNSQDPPQEKSYPVCTIKNFPNQPEHTIHWAMDYFDFFRRAPENVNNYILKGNDFINSLSGYDRNVAKNDIMKYCVKYKPQSLYDFVVWSCDIFLGLYRDQILQLLHSFPKDSLNADGELFWSKGKRCPNVVEFDIENELVIDFIESCTHLLSKTCDLDDNFSRGDLKTMLVNYKPYIYEIDETKKIAKNDSELKDISEEDSKNNQEIMLENIVIEKRDILSPELFEKDDDSNWHIAFIKAASNLRCSNYGIPISSFDEVKGIAGKIIPAVATTTSIVSGLISMEIIKYCQGFSNVEQYKSYFVNLATNTLVSTEPVSAPKLKFGDTEINSWTKFELNDDITLNKFIKLYEDKFKTKLSMVLFGTSILFADFMVMDNGMDNKLLSKLFSEKYSLDLFTEDIEIIIAPEDDEIELPAIQVKLGKAVKNSSVI